MGIILLAQERLAEPTPVEELIPLEELASAAASVSAGPEHRLRGPGDPRTWKGMLSAASFRI